MRKLKQEWDKLSEKKNLKGAEALEAVKQDGCALQYVSSEMFSQENKYTIEQLEELTGIMNLKIKK
jgi:hypothetical protein